MNTLPSRLTPEQALALLRADPRRQRLLHDAYLDMDPRAAAERFRRSAEFAAVEALLNGEYPQTVVDLGAGTGIAAYAFAAGGARHVWALEPDLSPQIGAEAVRAVTAGLPVTVVACYGEAIPLPDESVDLVYARQVLHHTQRLAQVLQECRRILRPGGRFVACREHVVDDDAQLAAFLRTHPFHALTGGEHAFPLPHYLAAIAGAGLELQRLLGPWDSVINAYPGVASAAELARYPQILLRRRAGHLGGRLAGLPGVQPLIWRRLRRPVPGRLYTFVAVRP